MIGRERKDKMVYVGQAEQAKQNSRGTTLKVSNNFKRKADLNREVL